MVAASRHVFTATPAGRDTHTPPVLTISVNGTSRLRGSGERQCWVERQTPSCGRWPASPSQNAPRWGAGERPGSSGTVLFQHGSVPVPHGPVDACPHANARPAKNGSFSSLETSTGNDVFFVGDWARLMHLSTILEDERLLWHGQIAGREPDKDVSQWKCILGKRGV